MARDLPTAKLLRECGYQSVAAQAAGRAALEAAGITREGKERDATRLRHPLTTLVKRAAKKKAKDIGPELVEVLAAHLQSVFDG